jgi:predicted phage terminase large subunit-like protein
VGVGGPITGRGAHLAIIDDPVKNQQDADSETIRESVWNWYLTTLKTRLMPGGAIILMMTRWHEDDLAGRILKEEGDEWEVIKLPAVTDGKALWPEWFPLSELETHKKHARTWQALYQQNPTPEEGTYFKREDIPRHRLDEVPERLHSYMTSDFAVTALAQGDESNDPDYTVFGHWGIDSDGKWWLVDRYKKQSKTSEWVEVWTDWVKRKGFLKAFGEKGVIRNAVEPFLKQSMTDAKAYCSMEWITRNRDKVAMASAFRGLLEQGKVSIPLTDWGEDIVTELLKFPAGEHDDQVDMCTLLGLAVTQGVAATKPEPEEEIKQKRDYVFEDEDPDNWKLA